MEHRVDSVLHPSGRTFYLSSLASGMKVLSGELNLFLIRFEADGSAGDRAFLAVLRAGDAFCPETSICVGGIRSVKSREHGSRRKMCRDSCPL